MKLIELGKISKPHGFRGAFVVYAPTGQASALAYVKEIRIGLEAASSVTYKIIETSWMPRGWKVVVEGITSDTQVNSLRGALVFTERTSLKETENDEFYVSDLVGAQVQDESGASIGTFVGVEPLPGQQDRWWVELKSGETIAIPATKQFVLGVDIKNRSVTVYNVSKLR